MAGLKNPVTAPKRPAAFLTAFGHTGGAPGARPPKEREAAAKLAQIEFRARFAAFKATQDAKSAALQQRVTALKAAEDSNG